MPTFTELLTASDSTLVRHFYRFDGGADRDFIKRINRAAAALGVNHTELVCALGFNPAMRELTDILTVLGFSSYKPLTYRRNELFVNDIYRQLSMADLTALYAADIDDDEIIAVRATLVRQRLTRLEQQIDAGNDPLLRGNYRAELEAIYESEVATPAFVDWRLSPELADRRLMTGEIEMVVAARLVPLPNLFYSEQLKPAEKRFLLESGGIEKRMVENRLQNAELPAGEKELLEDYLRRH